MIPLRLGIAVGPYDMTDRFTYWVRRLARGGRVLGPPRRDQPIQVIAATDEAAFVLPVVWQLVTAVVMLRGA